MKRIRSHASRTIDKTFEKLLSLKLLNDYSLSPVEAKTLTLDIKSHIDKSHNTLVKEGEILFTAVLSDEPAGKPLRQCKTKQIKKSLFNTVKNNKYKICKNHWRLPQGDFKYC